MTSLARESPRASGRSLGRRARDWVPAIFGFGFGLATWQWIFPWLGVERFLLPPLADVLRAFWDARDELVRAGWVTFQEALGGFVLGCSLAFCFALVLARWRPLGSALMPYLMFKGWIYCRDHLIACTNIVLANGPALPRGHQMWQMNEVNALIWPNRLGVGLMDPVEYKRTADIALTYKVIKKPASKASYRTDLARKAIANLKKQGLDVNGKRFKKAVVKLKLGGK